MKAIRELVASSSPAALALRVWEEEPWVGRKARKFVVAPLAKYMDVLEKRTPPNRRSHELILPDRPVRIFFDLESETATREEMDAAVAEVVAQVGCAPIILDGSREGKQSRHLIFPRAVRTIAHLKTYVEEFHQAYIDHGVYTAFRSFRAPFCTACDKVVNMGGPGFDRTTFENGLVMVGESLVVDVMDTPDPPPPNPPKFERVTSADWSQEEIDRVRRTVENNIAGTVDVTTVRDAEIEFQVAGCLCVLAERVHRNNRMYVHVRLPRKPKPGFDAPQPLHAYAYCMHPECKKMVYMCDFAKCSD